MLILKTLSPLLARIEADLAKVQRWTQFQSSSGSRSQTTLAHTASIQLVALTVLEAERVENTEPFDASFVLGSLATHDLGEVVYAEDGADTLHDHKSADKDRAELEAFRKMIKIFPQPIRDQLLNHYLLQFVGKDNVFDDDVQARLASLDKKRRIEAQLFMAIEYLDYMLYAYHEYVRVGNLRIMVHTIRRQHAKLKALAAELPGFARLYTQEIILWAETLLRDNERIPEHEIPDRANGEAFGHDQLAFPYPQMTSALGDFL